MRATLVFWVEEYLYHPNLFQKLLSVLLLPLSWLYCCIMWCRFYCAKEKDYGVDIVSVGNLTVGGSGKTPLVSALAHECEDVAIILRGYGRASKGMVVVKERDKIVCNVAISGDEAMIYAKKLPHAVVIVSEKRGVAIEHAKSMGIRKIFLDDAYSKHSIKKKDIVIGVETPNSACLPAGPFRERLWRGKKAVVVYENKDFFRHVSLKNATAKMSLVTAIARPQRLDKYLPQVVNKHYFEDHHTFTKEELLAILQADKSESLLVTFKDYVKIESFGLPLSLLDLEITLNKERFKEFVSL